MSVTVDQAIYMEGEGRILAFPVKVNTAILKGTICIINKDGYMEPLTSTNVNNASIPVIAYDAFASNATAGSRSTSFEEGTNLCRAYVDGIFKLTTSGLAQADEGNVAYATDNYTVGVTQTAAVKLGTIIAYLSATSAYIDLNRYYNDNGSIEMKVALTATSTATGGAILNLANPIGETALVELFMIDLTTASTAAATVDVGKAASATSNDTVIDGLSLATIGVFSNLSDPGTNGGHAKVLSSQYITATAATGNAKSIVGTALIRFRPWQ